MDMIICRTRISGQAPLYSYRVLVPLDQLAPHRRHRVVILHVPTPAGRLPCTRLADLLAPGRWFERYLAMHCGLAARLNLVSRRVEAIILQAIFPEMTTRLVPPMLLLDHEPDDGSFPMPVGPACAASCPAASARRTVWCGWDQSTLSASHRPI